MTRRMKLVRIAVLLVSLVEVPLWLLRNRRLLQNPVAYPFSHWSFGHTVSGLDFAARLYHPRRISLVDVPHKGSNPYLPRCFEESMDVFRFDSLLAPKTVAIDAARRQILNGWLRLLTRLKPGVALIDVDAVYRSRPLAPGPLYMGDEDGTLRLEMTNYTGYLRLLRASAGVPPRLPDRLRARCSEAIEARHPGFLDRPFATLLLREKGVGFSFDTASRTVGDQRNYRAAVELLGEHGFAVVGTGETSPAAFAGLSAFYDLSDVDVPPALLNVFLISECALFIGQQSGPFVLADSRGIPCVICDAFPYRLGTFQPDDLVVFKPLIGADSERLSFAEIFRERQELAYGYGFAEAGITIGASSSEEIVEAVDETLARLDGELRLSEDDLALCAAFQALVPTGMPLHYHGNRPPLAALRRERATLLP